MTIRMTMAAALLCLGLGGLPATAAEVEPWDEKPSPAITGLDLQLSAGYREDELDWNIAGNGVNIMSELTWEDLEIYQLRATGTFRADPGAFQWIGVGARAAVGYGWIVDGENQDSDYDGNDRTLEFSRSNNKTDGDDAIDLSAAVGPWFRTRDGRFLATPLLGFSYHEQNLRITDGVQTLPPLGPFPGLDSTYETRWTGPWTGIDLEFRPVPRLLFTGSLEYHWVDYYAEADWNLRPKFDHPRSFEHEADGEGVVLSAAAAVKVGENWNVALSYTFQDWETDPGTHRTFWADGTYSKTRLNEVNWESQGVMLGVTYSFL